MLEYLQGLYLATYIEITAALVAVISLVKYRAFMDNGGRLIVFLLIYTSINEIVGHYPRYIYDLGINKNEFFTNNPSLKRGYWLSNIYALINFFSLGLFFLWELKQKRRVQILKWCLALFVILSIANLLISDDFFNMYSKVTDVLGLGLLIVAISFYYYEILIDTVILKIGRTFPFYVSIPVLIYYVCTTPLILLNDFYLKEELIFRTYFDKLISLANYFLYGMFIFGYLWCYWFNKSINRKSSSLSTSS
ncbi:MAG: hypothetical protein ACI828_000708 [Flavobacteriales bacterium]